MVRCVRGSSEKHVSVPESCEQKVCESCSTGSINGIKMHLVDTNGCSQACFESEEQESKTNDGKCVTFIGNIYGKLLLTLNISIQTFFLFS